MAAEGFTPDVDLDEVRYAGERLDDYHTAQTTGPPPTDPILGGDARSRARTRLEMQQQLEQGLFGTAPIPPDQATAMLDQAQSDAEALVVTRVQEQLQHAGMTPEGPPKPPTAWPKELCRRSSSRGPRRPASRSPGDKRPSIASEIPTGRHWGPDVATFSASDIETLKRVGGRLGVVGSLVDVGVGL